MREDIKEFVASIPNNVTLVAATKYVDSNEIRKLVNNGVDNIAENRVDAFLNKYDETFLSRDAFNRNIEELIIKAKKIIEDEIFYAYFSEKNFEVLENVDVLTLNSIFADAEAMYTEEVKDEIVRVLTGPGLIQTEGRLTLTKIYERFENIYKGYALEKIYNNYTYKGEGIQAIDKQFFMHPYAGLRFEFNMTTRELCQRYVKP